MNIFLCDNIQLGAPVLLPCLWPSVFPPVSLIYGDCLLAEDTKQLRLIVYWYRICHIFSRSHQTVLQLTSFLSPSSTRFLSWLRQSLILCRLFFSMMGLLVRRLSAAAALASTPRLSVVLDGMFTLCSHTTTVCSRRAPKHTVPSTVFKLLTRCLKSLEFITLVLWRASVLANGSVLCRWRHGCSSQWTAEGSLTQAACGPSGRSYCRVGWLLTCRSGATCFAHDVQNISSCCK